MAKMDLLDTILVEGNGTHLYELEKMIKSIPTTFYALLLTCLLPQVLCFGDLNYAYLIAMGGSCYPQDSCHSVSPRNCRCDQNCANYGDCCIDSYERFSMKGLWKTSDWECIKMSPNISVLTKAKCLPNWSGNPIIQKQCESSDGVRTGKDVLSTLPITSRRSLVTYKNYFCALCNDDTGNATFWDAAIACASLEKSPHNVSLQYIHDSLEYDPLEKSWGVTLPEDDFTIFYPCSVFFNEVPIINQGLEVRACTAPVVSQCSMFWKDNNVRQKCEDYQAIMVGPKKITYRNIHCALCNFVNIRSLVCPNDTTAELVPLPHHSIIYDVVSGTSSIGETTSCDDKEILDPFYKRCQSLQCVVPGLSLVDGKCVSSVS